MESDRWRRIEELYNAVVEQPAGDRALFLQRASTDADIVREVESLLARDVTAGGPLDRPDAADHRGDVWVWSTITLPPFITQRTFRMATPISGPHLIERIQGHPWREYASGLSPLGTARGAISYCGRILCMPRGNPSPKLAITVDPEVHENILAAAASDRVSVSAWMTTAAREALKRRAGLAAVELWEEQHGRFSPEEMKEARLAVREQLRSSRTVRRPA